MQVDSEKIDDYIKRIEDDNQGPFDFEINTLLTLSKRRWKKDLETPYFDYKREISSTCPQNLVFVKRSAQINTVPGLKALNIPHETINYCTIIFVPVLTQQKDNPEKKYSLYAITMGHGWRTLLPFVDYNFQKIMPAKILSSEGAKVTEVKSVLGSRRSKAEVFDKEVSLKDLEYGDICTAFSANLDTKEITEGKSRQKLLFPYAGKNKKINVQVGIGRMKFSIKQTFPNLVRVTRVLEDIYTDKSNKYNIKGSKLNRRALSVGFKQKIELDKELSDSVRTLLGATDFDWNEGLHTFDICYKFPKDYTESTDVEVKFAKERESLEDNPDLHAVLKKVWNILLRVSTKSKSMSEEYLKDPNLLWNIMISFGNTGDRPQFHALPKLLRGSFFSKTYEKFFLKFGETWYNVDDDYIIGIQNKFQEILQQHLIVSNSKFHPLNKAWPMTNVVKHNKDCREGKPNQKCRGCKRKKTVEDGKYWVCDEEVYNNLYKDENGYYIGDCETLKSIEYFDVVLDNDKQSFFCHIKRGFGNHTRDVCSQLLNSYEILTSLDPRGQKNRESYKIKKIVQKVFDNDKERGHRILGIGGTSPNSKAFVMGLCTNENPVLTRPFSEEEILKIRDGNLNTWIDLRSLEVEKDLKQVIDESYLAKYIKDDDKFNQQLRKAYNCDAESIYEKLKLSLIDKNFIRESKSELLVTSKLLLCDSQSELREIFPSPDSTSAYLLKSTLLMLQKYTTHYESLGAKLEVIRCVKILRQTLEVERQFYICEMFIGGKISQAQSAPIDGGSDLIGTTQSNEVSNSSEMMEVDESDPPADKKIANAPKPDVSQRPSRAETQSEAGKKSKPSKRKR
jgi:hypothetical protein